MPVEKLTHCLFCLDSSFVYEKRGTIQVSHILRMRPEISMVWIIRPLVLPYPQPLSIQYMHTVHTLCWYYMCVCLSYAGSMVHKHHLAGILQCSLCCNFKTVTWRSFLHSHTSISRCAEDHVQDTFNPECYYLTCWKWERREIYAWFLWENLKKRAHLEDPGTDVRIILKWISNRMAGHELD